jgi:hypothetical protein
MAVLGSILNNSIAQLAAPIVAEQLIPPEQFLPTPLRASAPEATACASLGACITLPRAPIKVSEGLTLALSALFLGWRLSRQDVAAAVRERMGATGKDQIRIAFMTGLFAALIVANAVVCGSLSSVAPRYQARIVWLEPLCALICAVALPIRTRPGRQRRNAARP